MSHQKLPLGTRMSQGVFISAMNKALSTLPFYREGMAVCADENGYWLEIDGEVGVGNEDMLSAARKIVLGD